MELLPPESDTELEEFERVEEEDGEEMSEDETLEALRRHITQKNFLAGRLEDLILTIN